MKKEVLVYWSLAAAAGFFLLFVISTQMLFTRMHNLELRVTRIEDSFGIHGWKALKNQ